MLKVILKILYFFANRVVVIGLDLFLNEFEDQVKFFLKNLIFIFILFFINELIILMV